jgi:hypothetical protein
MNQRERILAISVLAAVILAVGGFLFKWLFLDGLGRIKADIETVKLEINKKGADQRKELDEEKALERDDPRLTQWQVRSLPEDNNREAYIKSGHSAEEARKHHEDMVQVDYSHYLNDLVVKSGFTANSIKISSAPADRKGGPILSGKTPAYTRMTFTVQAQGKLDSVERLLADFYATPLLHEVRNITLTARAPTPTRTAAPGGFARNGAGAAPGGALGGVPAIPGLAGGLRNGAASAGDLDLSMTVEALLVAGAQKRDELMPKTADLKEKVQTLARSTSSRPTDKKDEPRYTDILAKNMFTGVAATTQLKEDFNQVLSVVRLTSLWNDRHWQAAIFNQSKPLVSRSNADRGGSVISDNDQNEIVLNLTTLKDTFTLTDAYKNEILTGKAEKINADGIIFQRGKMVRDKDGKQVFQGDGRYYRWRCGEFLGDRLASNGDAPAGGASAPRGFPSLDTGDDSGDGGASEPSSKYIRGALYTPLTADELKDAGIETSSSSAGN